MRKRDDRIALTEFNDFLPSTQNLLRPTQRHRLRRRHHCTSLRMPRQNQPQLHTAASRLVQLLQQQHDPTADRRAHFRLAGAPVRPDDAASRRSVGPAATATDVRRCRRRCRRRRWLRAIDGAGGKGRLESPSESGPSLGATFIDCGWSTAIRRIGRGRVHEVVPLRHVGRQIPH